MNSVKTKIKGGIYTKRNKATDGQGQSKRSKAKDDQVKTQDDQDACHDTVLGCDVIPTIERCHGRHLDRLGSLPDRQDACHDTVLGCDVIPTRNCASTDTA